MSKRTLLTLTFFFFIFIVHSKANILIDTFNDSLETVIVSTTAYENGTIEPSDPVSTIQHIFNDDTIGGIRKIYAEILDGVVLSSPEIAFGLAGDGALKFFVPQLLEGYLRVTWDGDFDETVLNVTGLEGIDVTMGGNLDRFAITFTTTTFDFYVTLTVYSSESAFSAYTIDARATSFIPGEFVLMFPFSEFAAGFEAADFTDVGAIVLEIHANPASFVDLDLDILEVLATDGCPNTCPEGQILTDTCECEDEPYCPGVVCEGNLIPDIDNNCECYCNVVFCPVGVLDPVACECVPEKCPGVTCEGNRVPNADNNCACECIPNVCDNGEQDPITCECPVLDCSGVICEGNQVPNVNDNCTCECPAIIICDNGEQDPITCECPVSDCSGVICDGNQVPNPDNDCACECPPTTCTTSVDPVTCECIPECASPCPSGFEQEEDCSCTCVRTCSFPRILEPTNCVCTCGTSCSPPLVLNPTTCGCGCPSTACAAPLVVVDITTCECGCPSSISCPSPKVPDSSTCACVCPNECDAGQTQDPQTCRCIGGGDECPELCRPTEGCEVQCRSGKVIINVRD